MIAATPGVLIHGQLDLGGPLVSAADRFADAV